MLKNRLNKGEKERRITRRPQVYRVIKTYKYICSNNFNSSQTEDVLRKLPGRFSIAHDAHTTSKERQNPHPSGDPLTYKQECEDIRHIADT